MIITLEQLRYLSEIADKGSITAASDSLGRAKSAIHYSIKNLEEQLGFTVIDTKAYRGKLTAKGEQFLTRAKELLDSYEKLKSDVQHIARGVESKLAISATALYSLKKLNKLIIQLQKQCPNTEIVFHREILSGAELLRSEVVDIALFENLRLGVEFQSHKIDEIEMHLVIATKHPFLLLPKKEQTLKNLLYYPQVIQRSTLPSDEQEGVHKNSKQWTVSDLDSKKEIIVDGLGWGRLPLHEINKEMQKDHLTCLGHIEKPFKVPIYIARKKNKHTGIVSQTFWNMLTK